MAWRDGPRRLLLASNAFGVGDEASAPPGTSASAFHAPETLRLNLVIPQSTADTAPPIHSTINDTPLANLPPARADHDGLVAFGGFLALGIVLVIGACWLVQQAVHGKQARLRHE